MLINGVNFVELVLGEFKLLLWVVCLGVRIVTSNSFPNSVRSVAISCSNSGLVTIGVSNLNQEASCCFQGSDVVVPVKANLARQVVVMKVDMVRNVALRSSNSNSLGVGVSAWALITGSTDTELVSLATLELSATKSCELIGGPSGVDVITENSKIIWFVTITTTKISNRNLVGIDGAASFVVGKYIIPTELNNSASLTDCKVWRLWNLDEFEVKAV